MNAHRLLAVYDRVAETQDAVERLRRLVLDLAVRGQLAEQDRADEPASELLKRIAAEKARLRKTGKLRKRKIPSRIGEPPFALPTNWYWARIRDVLSDRGQRVPDRRFTYIDVSAIDKKAGLVADPRVLEPAEAPSRARKVARSGDVLYSCVRPYLLNVAVVDADFDPPPIASTAFEVLNGHGLVLPRYTWIVLRCSFMIACVEQSQRGQSYPAINSTAFAVLPFPLPPLAEQHRIVAKVQELLALCDRLEETHAAREATRARLSKASLTRLKEPATDPATFRAHTRFAVNALPALTQCAEHVENIRQTTLDLAVRGKLVEQDPADEPASEFAKRIATERARSLEARAIRRPKPIEALDEAPFAIPPNWKWTRLGDLAELVRGVSFPASAKSDEPAEGLLPCLRSGNIQTTTVWDNLIHVPESVVTSAHKLLSSGDVLISIANSYALVGKCSIVRAIPHRATFGAFLAAIRFHLVLPEYAKSFLQSEFSLSLFRAGSSQTTNIANITFSTIRRHPFPLPPLAEQHRIVEKIDELMALCDRLKAGLGAAERTRSRLIDSLIHESLASGEPHP